ncbi:hypothetical protein [Pseudonocardia sp. NPDC049635]|uniref:phage portal protein family protein n=1 Tax=Pseudonocardia sp. NPDC049635 TaxID=3155506 RepID=UPI0033E58156
MSDTPNPPVTELGFGNVNPATWWGSIDEPTPELRWPLNVKVYDRMRRTDTQVQSVLRAVTMPIRRTSWRLSPNGARDEVVAQIAEDLGLPIDGDSDVPRPVRTRDRFSWTEHLRLAMLSLVFGHMPFEQVCRLDERGRVRLRKLAPRMPATISEFDVARDGGLRSIVQDPPSWSSPTELLRGQKPPRAVRIPINRLVVYSNEREAGNWQGQSMLRAAYKFWLLKDRILRIQAMTLDRNGMGLPLYKGAAKNEDLKPGLQMATDWRSGEAAGAAVPNGADLLLRGVEGDLPDADRVIRYYDEQIARGALLHFLNLGTQTGSWALGSTFAEFFQMSLQTLADDVKDVVDQHVIEDLVDWNWGIDERAPRLICDEIGSRHPATPEALKALADAGIVLPDRDLEQAVRHLYGLPPKGAYSQPAGSAPNPAPAPGGTTP